MVVKYLFHFLNLGELAPSNNYKIIMIFNSPVLILSDVALALVPHHWTVEVIVIVQWITLL